MEVTNRMATGLSILISMLCYYNSISCGFVFDDISAIEDNKDIRPTTPLQNLFRNDFWGTPIRKERSHKSYRPLCVLTFRWNYWVNGLQPANYHSVNVILHMVVCWLYNRVCGKIVPQFVGALATVLFAAHPVHTEAVTGVVGRAELLCSVFFLLAFLSYIKMQNDHNETNGLQWILFTTFTICSLLCKEQGITITGVCVVYELVIIQQVIPYKFNRKSNSKVSLVSIKLFCKKLWRVVFLMIFTIFLLLFRLNLMGAQLPTFTRFDNPASVENLLVKQLTYNYLLAVNFWLLIFPSNLCCDWTMGTIPLVKAFSDIRNLYTVLIFSHSIIFIRKLLISSSIQSVKILSIAFSLMVLPFLPASNFFYPVGFVIAERVLYIPSMGFCMLTAYGFYLIHEKMTHKKIPIVMLLLLLVPFMLRTHIRNRDWKNEYSLFISGLKINQKNAKLFNNVGHALENSKNYSRALIFFKKAVQVQSDDIGAYINLGRTYNNLKMFTEAEVAYKNAITLLPNIKPGEVYQARIAPNHLNVFLNLANLIARNSSRLKEADILYKQAISMRSDYTQAYINRGDILMKLNRSNEARKMYETALLYDEDNADIYFNLGVVYHNQGLPTKALAHFEKAMKLEPLHEQSLLNSAILLQEIGNGDYRKEARIRLNKLLFINETNELIHFNLAMLEMDERNMKKAEQHFKRAIQLYPKFRSALFNLALLLVDIGRPLEAIPFLKQLLSNHPAHVKGLILLGDIYINNLKNFDKAEKCYLRILKLEPNNIQGLHNLCVVYVERGNFKKGLDCLKVAHNMAPLEEYITRHILVVESRLQKIISYIGKKKMTRIGRVH